jgi:hypothetical protein
MQVTIKQLEDMEQCELIQVLKFINLIDSVKCRESTDIIGDQNG